MLVKIAGLCHDVGHGPFSHCFEQYIKVAKPNSHFHHEEMSCKIFEHIVKKYQVPLTDNEIKRVQNYILGNREEGDPHGFLCDIVANKRNSVDVDKWDYLARDCYMCGLKNSFDFKRYVSLLLLSSFI